MCGGIERITKWQKEEPTSYTNYRVALLVSLLVSIPSFLFLEEKSAYSFWQFGGKLPKNCKLVKMYSEMKFSYIYFREFDPLYGNQMKNVGFGTSNYSKFWDDISWLSSQSTVVSPPFN